jgi:hypothetical protein
LVRIVEPLAKAVETQLDERTTALALQVLRSLIVDLSCLEKLLSLGTFRAETLEVLHKAGDEKEATELISCVIVAENEISMAEGALKESEQYLKNPPSVRSLAEIFNKLSPLDGELTMDQLLQACRLVPVGPERDIKAALSGNKLAKFSFGAFAQHIYGTPTLLGWWPSLMEHTAELWSHPMHHYLGLPALTDLLSFFELGAKGSAGVTSDTILHEVLPAWNLSSEGELVEDLFAEIRGDKPLNFVEFGLWMSRYFKALNKQHHEAELRQKESMEEARKSA